MIHHETWAANYMNESPASVFSTCIKIVNFIKGTVKTLFAWKHRSWNGNWVQVFVTVYGSQMAVVRPRCVEIVWTARRTYVSLSQLLTDETWLARSAYLADIFNILNSLNLAMQGSASR